MGKDSDAGRDGGRRRRGTTEDEMAGWHHQLNGRESSPGKAGISGLHSRLPRKTLGITFIPRSKRLLISWLQSPSAVILEPPKIKSATVFTVSPYICHEVMHLLLLLPSVFPSIMVFSSATNLCHLKVFLPRGEALFRCARPSGVPRGPAASTEGKTIWTGLCSVAEL